MQRSAKPEFLWESTHYHSEGKKDFLLFWISQTKLFVVLDIGNFKRNL